jgi:hypothetical protein
MVPGSGFEVQGSRFTGSQVQGSKVTTDEHCSPYYYRFGIPADPIGLKGFINAIKTELL